jgi:hypothetical protein
MGIRPRGTICAQCTVIWSGLKYLHARSLSNRDDPFLWMLRHLKRALRSMVLKAMLPVRAHPQFIECKSMLGTYRTCGRLKHMLVGVMPDRYPVFRKNKISPCFPFYFALLKFWKLLERDFLSQQKYISLFDFLASRLIIEKSIRSSVVSAGSFVNLLCINDQKERVAP